MAATTIYDVKLRYALDDRASRGIKNVGSEARQAAKGAGLLSGALTRALAAGAGFLTLRAAKKALIDYNSSLDQARMTTEALLTMNMGGSFVRNQERANFLISRFKKDSAASVGTMKDFSDMSGLIVGPLSRAGASVREVADITKGAVIASRAFGVEADNAARDIESALAGTLGAKDRFARALLEPMGLTTAKWNKMVKETPGKATAALLAAFNQPAIKMLAERQRTSWAGVASTLEDNFKRAFGKIGIPLMKTLTEEATKLNDFFTKDPKRVAQWTQAIGQSLVSGFNAVKSAMRFVSDNRGLLTLLAKAYLIQKGVRGLAQGLLGLDSISRFGGLIGKKVNPGLGTFVTKLGNASAGLLAFYLAAKAFAQWVDERQSEAIAKKAAGTTVVERARAMAGLVAGRTKVAGVSANVLAGASLQAKKEGVAVATVLARGVAREAESSGIVRKGKVVSGGKLASMFGGGQGFRTVAEAAGVKGAATPKQWIDALTTAEAEMRSGYFITQREQMLEFLRGLEAADDASRKALFVGMERVYREGQDALAMGSALWRADGDKPASEDKGKASGSRNTNVTIQKIEVVSDDPDRFALDLVDAFDRYSNSPSQSRATVKEL